MRIEKPAPAFTDDRGTITDILVGMPADAITRVDSAAGAVRGNHVHRESEQYIYLVTGRLKYAFESATGERGEKVIVPGDLVATPPGEAHAILVLEASMFLVFTRGPRSGSSYESDTFRLDVPLIPPSDAR